MSELKRKTQQGTMDINTHHVVVCFGAVVNFDQEKLNQQPGVKVYRVDGPDLQDQIDRAQLEDLHCQRTTVSVGGAEAGDEAAAYGVTWIEDTPAVNGDLLQFWPNTVPEWDSP